MSHKIKLCLVLSVALLAIGFLSISASASSRPPHVELHCATDDSETRAYARGYTFGFWNEEYYCYSVEAVCSGSEVVGDVSAIWGLQYEGSLSVGLSGYDTSTSYEWEAKCGPAGSNLGYLTQGWSTQCRFSRGTFEVKVNSVNLRFCPGIFE